MAAVVDDYIEAAAGLGYKVVEEDGVGLVACEDFGVCDILPASQSLEWEEGQ